jgi:hypothetical protein
MKESMKIGIGIVIGFIGICLCIVCCGLVFSGGGIAFIDTLLKITPSPILSSERIPLPTMNYPNQTIQQTQSQNKPKQLETTNVTVVSGSPTQDMKLNMSMIELFSYVKSLTQLQRSDFLKSIDGKTVDWTGLVDDVQSDGSILIDVPSGRCYVNLSKVSMEVAKTVKKGTNINFT